MPPLPIIDEFNVPPVLEELRKASKSPACGEAPSNNGSSQAALLITHLHELLLQCRKMNQSHPDRRDAKITMLCESEGDRSDCNDRREIPLLSTVN